MKKPYILAVDDDASVLRAVERDLRARFSSDFWGGGGGESGEGLGAGSAVDGAGGPGGAVSGGPADAEYEWDGVSAAGDGVAAGSEAGAFDGVCGFAGSD